MLKSLAGKLGSVFPVTIITLVVELIERIRLSTSIPFIPPGNRISSKTRSGRDSVKRFKPSSPVSAPTTP
jgi:hypothetical protein